jgi:hypothetical protein
MADILYGFTAHTLPAILRWEFGKWIMRQVRRPRG